jgi:hypothetical protein
MTLSTGTRLGPYEILSPLGAGGMGEVYRARDTRLGCTVAVKVLPSHLSASADVRQRFEREAKTGLRGAGRGGRDRRVPRVRAGTPKPLFQIPEGAGFSWDVTSDGERFLVSVPVRARPGGWISS